MSDPFSTPVVDPFMQSGNAEAIKFTNPGDTHSIVVRKVEEKIDTSPDGTVKTWSNGDPMHVYVFNGDVDGEPRSLWVRGNMVTAIREATVKAGLSTVVDTKVTIRFTDYGTPSQKGFSPPKLFIAKVEKVAPAASSALADEEPF